MNKNGSILAVFIIFIFVMLLVFLIYTQLKESEDEMEEFCKTIGYSYLGSQGFPAKHYCYEINGDSITTLKISKIKGELYIENE